MNRRQLEDANGEKRDVDINDILEISKKTINSHDISQNNKRSVIGGE
jgi:hypothetical protein